MTTLPQCMQCSSYVGTLEGLTFKCGSCGCRTDQPAPAAQEDQPTEQETDDTLSVLHVDELRVLLEAYDTGTNPFNMNSEARDLQPLVEGIFDKMEHEYLAERTQALIEAVTDTLAPSFEGLQADILALIEEHLPDET